MKEGTSLTTLLFIAFLVLKLTNVIDWSWWWITSPLWIPFTFAVFALFVYFSFLDTIEKQNNLVKKIAEWEKRSIEKRNNRKKSDITI